MTWLYSGNPATSDVDKYRFLIGDTISTEPVLQNEEIQYILTTYIDNNMRLYQLYDRASDVFARKVSKSLGPQHENTIKRQEHFEAKAAYYKGLTSASSGLSLPKSSNTIFTKGMQDNVRNP